VPYFKTGKDLRDRLNKEAARAAGLAPAEPAGDKK
jgi:integration host factor subunit beta